MCGHHLSVRVRSVHEALYLQTFGEAIFSPTFYICIDAYICAKLYPCLGTDPCLSAAFAPFSSSLFLAVFFFLHPPFSVAFVLPQTMTSGTALPALPRRFYGWFDAVVSFEMSESDHLLRPPLYGDRSAGGGGGGGGYFTIPSPIVHPFRLTFFSSSSLSPQCHLFLLSTVL